MIMGPFKGWPGSSQHSHLGRGLALSKDQYKLESTTMICMCCFYILCAVTKVGNVEMKCTRKSRNFRAVDDHQ